MSITIFLSTVSDEFRSYRDRLNTDLTRHNVAVKVQEDFIDLGGNTLEKLETYIAHCDAVIHLVGDMTGTAATSREVTALLHKHPDLPTQLPPLAEALAAQTHISYTQWEAWLALYHNKLLLTATAAPLAPRDPKHAPTPESAAAQTAHLARLEAVRRYPGCTFTDPADLARHIAYTAILDLLVQDYARHAAQAQEVAEGFIREMASRVAADTALDLDGMKQAVRTAIDIYAREIASHPTQTNLGDIVDRALANARRLADTGKSSLALAALRKAAADLKREDDQHRRDEQDRHARFVAGITTLHTQERDLALAAYDAAAAAAAIIALGDALYADAPAARRALLIAEGTTLYDTGDLRGSNLHLNAAIPVFQANRALAITSDDIGAAEVWCGLAIQTLGAREGDTARLEQAITAYHAALEALTRDRVPLDWATTQNNLGNALLSLGARQTGTERLEQAVIAYRAALGVHTRERAPQDWAMTQNNLGNALSILSEREGGPGRLEQAVIAYRAALEEYTRNRAPLDWARTQNNLGNALSAVGEREVRPERLEQAIAAYRAALEEHTRDRVPLYWAGIQNNLGNALRALGVRESGTEHLEQSVEACRAALEERTRDRVPLDWATTQNNLGNALQSLGEREVCTKRLEQAVTAYCSALEERTRDRVPLDWAITQNNLGTALRVLANNEPGVTHLDAAITAWTASLTVGNTTWPSEWIAEVEQKRTEAQTEFNRRLGQ